MYPAQLPFFCGGAVAFEHGIAQQAYEHKPVDIYGSEINDQNDIPQHGTLREQYAACGMVLNRVGHGGVFKGEVVWQK